MAEFLKRNARDLICRPIEERYRFTQDSQQRSTVVPFLVTTAPPSPKFFFSFCLFFVAFLQKENSLLVVLSVVIVDNVEELELVDALGGRDDAQPVAELHLLEELLGQVLEVAARQVVVGNNLNLAVARLRDGNGLAQVADTAVDLDAVGKVLLEGGDVEDLVAGGLRGVDDELLGRLGGLAGLLLQEEEKNKTLAYCLFFGRKMEKGEGDAQKTAKRFVLFFKGRGRPGRWTLEVGTAMFLCHDENIAISKSRDPSNCSDATYVLRSHCRDWGGSMKLWSGV